MRTQSTRTPELLAPAGGLAQLEAALRFGADAVYLAADRFGLRQRAANFALDDVPAAAALVHDAGAKAYVTLNALMDADDLKALPAYLEALAAAGVDAFIVSDLGALRLAQRYAPNVELHVSTQASVCNAEAARVWHELGASRVVCAREMSVEDIARLRAGAPRELELEAFVHGAMCMAVSGRCLISAALTGRSGNKGHCTQPCRWSYALVEEQRPGEFFPVEEDVRGTYVMNAQDLNMLAHLDDLAAAGIDSFKIEAATRRRSTWLRWCALTGWPWTAFPPPSWPTSCWPCRIARTARASTTATPGSRPTWTATPPNAGMPPRWKRANRPAKARSA